MDNSPRIVLLRARPTRNAYLMDLQGWPADNPSPNVVIDSIVQHSHESWHGLESPILFHQAGELQAFDWTLLCESDVDQIHSLGILPNTLVRRITAEVAPIHLTGVDLRNGRIGIGQNGSGFHLGPEILQPFGERPLLIFDLAADCDPWVSRFVLRNFGFYAQWRESRHPEIVRRNMHVEKFLENVPTKRFPISDRESLAVFLNAAAGSRPMRGVPYQAPLSFVALCELAGNGQSYTHLRGHDSHCYLVHVGDEVRDFAAHWNYAWFIGNIGIPYRHQLWIPKTLAADASLHGALNNWLRHFSGWGNSNHKLIVVASESIPAAELDPMARSICQGESSSVPFHLRTPEQWAHDRQRIIEQMRYNPPMSGTEPNVHRRVVHGVRGAVDVPPPEVFGAKVQGSWMVDVQVDHLDQPKHVDSSRTWILPKRAGAIASQIFKAPARVNRAGAFSVELGDRGLRHEAQSEVRLQLPDESEIVRWVLLNGPGSGYRTDDLRYPLRGPGPLRQIVPSQDGRLLQGLLGLVGDLHTASHYLSRPFWQKLFRELSALDPRKDENLVRAAGNLLAKKFRHLNPSANTVERAARGVAGLLSGRSIAQDRTLRQCERLRLDLAKEERAQGRFAAGATQLLVFKFGGFSRKDMLREIDDLVGRNVLRIGGNLTCERCGVRQWHGLRDLDQTVACNGCDNRLTVPIDLQWSVQLNTLARSAVAQGVLGVLQALSGLGTHGRSFFFGPSYDLFREGSARAWHEIDVAAIVDGELVLGEVKEGRLKVDDLDGLVEVSELLRPAKALYFVNQAEWSPDLQRPFDDAKERLARLGVTLELHHLVIL